MGTIAVDPAVIPLGAALLVPGYGPGIASDTGSAVRGARVDVWFPTIEEALGWGRRTVTVTVYGGEQ
jgi:cystine transport system substrate-binding protein